MTKHTPGPWRHDMQAGVIWGPDDVEVANLLPASSLRGGYLLHDDERTEANARLLAAAPTLLEALAELKRKAREFSDADYAHAAKGGGIYFSADHIRGSAAAYADMVKHIEQAERACGVDGDV